MAADEETTNEDATSSKLGARPAHALRSAFGAVDANLREIESAVRTTSTSVFASDEDDLTHEDRTIVLEYVRRVRASMVAALATSGIRPRSRKRSLRDSLRTIVTFALIGVDEASPTKLRGYGELGSDDEARLETSLSELRRSLGELQQWLERPPSDDLRGRIESLTDVPVDVDHLLALEQAIVTHGMVDLRGPLRALVEALEARVFEIAVVGLVSCGKSTFLNALLETNVLPVGAEPVTSVPTRIVHGETPELVVLHANGRNERSTLEHVGDFVTEAGNPDNRKNVLRVTLRLPSRRLERHVALVDTPGLGPLARAGERSTYAYLPRCDSAVHLIDGTVGPRPADVEMARALRLSGIAVQTLLSKADLVPAAEREAVAERTKQVLTASIGFPVEAVWLDGTTDGAAAARAWFDRHVLPSTTHWRDALDRSALAKLDAIHARVVKALETPTTSKPTPTDAPFFVGYRELDRLDTRVRTKASAIDEIEPTIVHALATICLDVVGSARKDAAFEATSRIVEPLRSEIVLDVLGTIERVRASIGETDAVWNVDVLDLPSFRLPASSLSSPQPARWLPRALAERRQRRAIDEHAGDEIRAALRTFAREMREWLRATITRARAQMTTARALSTASSTTDATKRPEEARATSEALRRFVR